jgi:hypothetical protein
VSGHQTYANVLTDLGMAAAIAVYDKTYPVDIAAEGYSWGTLRLTWLAAQNDEDLKSRVTAMASAAATALARLPATELFVAAQKYGVPIPLCLAEEIAKHFAVRRDEVLTYRH